MSKGTIFNIQKFSLHDGPGIRTTVFLKGCPLKCTWCSNPESQFERVQILYDKSKCTNCNICINSCLFSAISSDHNIDNEKCTGCLQCVKQCPNNALSHEGELKEISEIMQVVMQDIDFYIESDGGVTLSGGEVCSQPSFAIELIKACKKENLHVAIETTGFTTNEKFKAIIEDVDLLLFDMKHYDDNKHIEHTGVSNKLIIENMKYACAINKDIIARIPVIPGVNDQLYDAASFCTLLQEIGIKEVNLLPFHQFGSKKYELLNMKYAFENIKQLHPEDLYDYQKVFTDYGFNCYF